METDTTRDAIWSEEKLQRIQAHLTGIWAEDAWPVTVLTGRTTRQEFLRFEFASPSLTTELKYAVWTRFENDQRKLENNQSHLYYGLQILTDWLNHIAPTTCSLLERSLESWIWSLRSYLVERKCFHPSRVKQLNASQTYREYTKDDKRIYLFRAFYHTIADAYDDRQEMDKDIWDMRKLGLKQNGTQSQYLLNFSSIVQPWLLSLAKQFMRYEVAIHSEGTCVSKLTALRNFSKFLVERAEVRQVQDIDRGILLKYITFLQARKVSDVMQNKHLVCLRLFLETSAHHLHAPGLSKERLIFDEDLKKVPQHASREIPEEVLFQLREHLEALPTTILRMVTVLLEVGMRINELCSLPLDCLIYDDKHEWYLRFYQRKSHKEHVVPLVDEKVIATLQTQQQEIRDRWGNTCPYLFPSPKTHLKPHHQKNFTELLNKWAVKHQIKDRNHTLYRFTAHQFRHTVGMRLLNDDVPLEVISRLLGHSSLMMTQVYARVKDKKLRTDLERVAHKRKTVDFQGQVVKGDPRANDSEAQMTRKGIRGQTLPMGGCGRLVVLGECSHANKCLTCPMWLTSTDDLLKLKSFYERAVRLKQRAEEKGNHFVVDQQEHIIVRSRHTYQEFGGH